MRHSDNVMAMMSQPWAHYSSSSPKNKNKSQNHMTHFLLNSSCCFFTNKKSMIRTLFTF